MKFLYPLICAGLMSQSVMADISRCHAISDDRDRLACYDSVTGRQDQAQPLAGVPAASGSTTSTSADDSVTAEPVERFGLLPERSAEPLVMNTSLLRVERNARGKMTLYLTNDQVWRQLDSSRLPLKSGEAIVIKEASLGSHLLEKQTGSRSIRVKRVR